MVAETIRFAFRRACHPSTGPRVVCRGFSDLIKCGSSSFDFGDDFFGGFVLDERFRVVVPVLGPLLDGVDELLNAGEAVAA